MVPASFEESNMVLGKPPSMSADECDALSVLSTQTQFGHPVVISCWKLTKQEAEELRKTERIWLTVFGNTMPPVALTADKPFESYQS